MQPTQQNLFYPILETLLKFPAGIHISQLYKKLEPYFPEMTSADFAEATGKKPESAWRLAVRWSKKKMTYDHKWLVANLPRGMCQISNAGRKAFDQMKQEPKWEPRYFAFMKFKKEHLLEGAVCPFCGGNNVEGESVDITGNEALQDCSCTDCDKQWRDEYVLTYVTELVT